ncbi:hypothetical protein ACEPAI_1873 [Sanghuangporus weigelae]
MVLTRRMARMAKEGATSTNTGEHSDSCTDPAAQVGNTDSSMCLAATIYGEAAEASVNNLASSIRGDTRANGAQATQISKDNSNNDIFGAPGPSSGRTKCRSGHKLTTSTKSSQATTTPDGPNPANGTNSPDRSIDSPSVHPQLKRGQKRQRDEGDNNKENVAVTVEEGTPPKRCVRHRAANTDRNETSAIPNNENIPGIVEVVSGSTSSHHRDAEAPDEVAIANVLLKFSDGVMKQTVMPPLLPTLLERKAKKTRIYLGLTALDNELLRILMEFSEVKKGEGMMEHPEATKV